MGDLRDPGDVVPVVIGGVSLILCNNKGTINAFHNVCRHRGAQLVSERCTKRKTILCPYHRWGYALDGRLMGTPAWDADEMGKVIPEKVRAVHPMPYPCPTRALTQREHYQHSTHEHYQHSTHTTRPHACLLTFVIDGDLDRRAARPSFKDVHTRVTPLLTPLAPFPAPYQLREKFKTNHVKDFDKKEMGLIPVEVDTALGMVFVNVDGKAPPLKDWLGDILVTLENYLPVRTKFASHVCKQRHA